MRRRPRRSFGPGRRSSGDAEASGVGPIGACSRPDSAQRPAGRAVRQLGRPPGGRPSRRVVAIASSARAASRGQVVVDPDVAGVRPPARRSRPRRGLARRRRSARARPAASGSPAAGSPAASASLGQRLRAASAGALRSARPEAARRRVAPRVGVGGAGRGHQPAPGRRRPAWPRGARPPSRRGPRPARPAPPRGRRSAAGLGRARSRRGRARRRGRRRRRPRRSPTRRGRRPRPTRMSTSSARSCARRPRAGRPGPRRRGGLLRARRAVRRCGRSAPGSASSPGPLGGAAASAAPLRADRPAGRPGPGRAAATPSRSRRARRPRRPARVACRDEPGRPAAAHGHQREHGRGQPGRQPLAAARPAPADRLGAGPTRRRGPARRRGAAPARRPGRP